MKIALIIAVWKRHDLEKIVIDSYIEQSKKFGFEIIIAGSEGDLSKKLAKGCHYIEVENSPLSNKHNALIKKAKSLNVDGVVLMGSDDLVSDAYWDWIYSQNMSDKDLLGLKDFYFYSTKTKLLSYWSGYQSGKQLAGAGRLFTKTVLDKMDWKLWDDNLIKGLDTNCSMRLNNKGIKERSVTMKEINAFLVDIKHTRSITKQDFIDNCINVNFEIMAKQVASKVVKKVKDLEPSKEQIFELNKEYEIIGTGTSKHFAKDEIVFVGGDICQILINKGYANLK